MTVVEVTTNGHRADLVLNRPDVLNAMNAEVFDGLAAAADTIAAADDVRVVVVSGNGRSFCSGIDTGSFGDALGAPAETVARFQSGFRKIAALPMPTIAAVHGHALGAGLQLALACDLRVAARDASLGLLEAKYGLVPDLCGTQRLPALVGAGRAKKMIWLAERIDGTEAERIGLVEVVAEPTDLEATVNDLASAIAAAPPLTVAHAKRLVELSGTVPLNDGMDEEARAQLQMFSSNDFGEAIAAFLEKRKPNYSGS